MLKSTLRLFGTVGKRPTEQYSVPRLSSSVVLCRRNKLFLAAYDYEILLLKRKSNTRAFAHVLTFPGGRVENDDTQLGGIIGSKKPVLTACLRELFQQTGIFLPKKSIVSRQQLDALMELAQSISRDALHGATKPYNYYKSLCSSPLFQQDILLDELIRLITIPSLPQRYDTYFFVKMLDNHKFVNIHSVCQRGIEHLEDTDNLVLDEDEHESFEWSTPAQTLNSYFQSKVKLAPPQFIILNILSKYRQFAQLKLALAEIATHHRQYPNLQESPLFFPQIVNLVHNTEKQSSQNYPFAAAFVGDRDFAYDKIIKNEKSESLSKEMQLYKDTFGTSQHLNRILFKDPKAMFEADFDVICNAPYSLLSSMVGKTGLTQRISQ